MRWRSPAAAILLAFLVVTPAAASLVVVPDQSPTVQSALDIDAGVDTVAIRDGLPPERLTVTRSVVIEAAGSPSPYFPTWTSAPVIQSMDIAASAWSVEVDGCRVIGTVKNEPRTDGNITFEACRFDSSFSDPGNFGMPFVHFSVRGCLIFGPVSLTGYTQFLDNTVIGGMVSVWSDGVHDIRNNYIEGPAEAGLKLSLASSAGQVAMNTIRGTTTGIRLKAGGYLEGNDIADCAGDGIAVDPYGFWYFQCDSNRVARCGGYGIIVRDTTSMIGFTHGKMTGNIVGSTGQGGIVLEADVFCYTFRGNTVLDAGGDGITLGDAPDVEMNVVGRSHGAGFRLTQGPDRFAGNTAFANGGPGIRLNADTYAGDSLMNNICAFNVGPGLSYEPLGEPHAGPPTLGCNDWFQNLGGTVTGMSPDPTDHEYNPQFCDLPAADVHLAASSQLLSMAGCGLIGALGQGCGSTSSVDGAISLMPRLRAWPVPARGAIAFEIPPSPGAAALEVFDVTGARRWGASIPAGATRLEWDHRDGTGHRAAPGVYFARLRRVGSEAATLRLVLAE